MLRHYYTLSILSNELKQLCNHVITDCFSQEKNSLTIEFSAENQSTYLQFSADTKYGALYLRKNFARARKNTVEIFKPILGKKLSSVELFANDRIIYFDFNDLSLFAQLFSGSKNNLFLADNQKNIIDALKYSDKYIDTVFEINPPKLNNISEFPPDEKLLKALSRCDLLLGKHYSLELLIRENIDISSKIRDFSDSAIDSIYTKAKTFREELISSKQYFLLYKKGGFLLSLKDLEGYEVIKSFSSISEAIHRRIIEDIKHKKYNDLYNLTSRKLLRRQSKLENQLIHIDDEGKSVERASKYRHYADLLLSQPRATKRHRNIIEIIDWDGQKLTIKLDNKLNLLENAKKYYDKAKSIEDDIKSRKMRLPGIMEELEKIENLLNIAQKSNNYKELETVHKEMRNISGINMQEEKNQQVDKFRRFDLGEGFELFVGKNAANNDELTMKFAKPHDLWMHARGTSGSHAVLPLGKNKRPPKHILQRAASISAYYSGARKAKYVPVAYTFKKYVRKPKGANPGSVVLGREDVIMAEPKLPE